MALRSAICAIAIAGVTQSAGQRLMGRAENSPSTGYDFVDPLIGTDNGVQVQYSWFNITQALADT
ncbi:glycoside hydrolase family 92 protein [Apiospora kogelbergensis]|uniref:Glycoside hydrolase family 92 protein n=1 Tax=Apiospora kogelbergensis TaxID=1337665 RepID=A0AAW0QXR1_9PEZI